MQQLVRFAVTLAGELREPNGSLKVSSPRTG